MLEFHLGPWAHYSEAHEIELALSEALNALSALESDSQHHDHDCGDTTWCPVHKARMVLQKHGMRKGGE